MESNPKRFNYHFLLRVSLVTAMGGLLFGYDWVVIGGAKPFYEKFFDIAHSPSLQGWAMSSALIGSLLGAIVSGILSDKIRSKKTTYSIGNIVYGISFGNRSC